MTQDTRTIPLSQGKVAIVDAADFDVLAQFKWHAHKCGANFCGARGISTKNGKRSILLMHRAIMSAPQGVSVDHINHDPLDNRRANLRLCTHSENCKNRTSHKDATSQYVGVCWYARRGKWMARLHNNGKAVFLGYFQSEKDAAVAYDTAARIHFGEFANPNFPSP